MTSHSGCIFCKIVHRELPTPFLLENEYLIVINDIAPKAPVHCLIIPKIHITNLYELEPSHKELAYEMLAAARTLTSKLQINAFNLVSNNGSEAGQIVFHMHFHFLAGAKFSDIVHKGGL